MLEAKSPDPEWLATSHSCCPPADEFPRTPARSTSPCCHATAELSSSLLGYNKSRSKIEEVGTMGNIGFGYSPDSGVLPESISSQAIVDAKDGGDHGSDISSGSARSTSASVTPA